MLCQPSVIDNYLRLLEYSKEEPIQEASCGALQNLSASSEVRTKMIIAKLNVLCFVNLLKFFRKKESQKHILGFEINAKDFVKFTVLTIFLEYN